MTDHFRPEAWPEDTVAALDRIRDEPEVWKLLSARANMVRSEFAQFIEDCLESHYHMRGEAGEGVELDRECGDYSEDLAQIILGYHSNPFVKPEVGEG